MKDDSRKPNPKEVIRLLLAVIRLVILLLYGPWMT
jgi:hypothetical protein